MKQTLFVLMVDDTHKSDKWRENSVCKQGV